MYPGLLLLLCLVCASHCYYPYGSEEMVELVPLRRVSRGLEGPPRYPQQRFRERYRPRYEPVQAFEPLEVSGSAKEPLVAQETGHSHQPHDYVDYGAYTGGYGAFGWYSDHPVQTHGY